jgi:hypothetical protein
MLLLLKAKVQEVPNQARIDEAAPPMHGRNAQDHRVSMKPPLFLHPAEIASFGGLEAAERQFPSHRIIVSRPPPGKKEQPRLELWSGDASDFCTTLTSW